MRETPPAQTTQTVSRATPLVARRQFVLARASPLSWEWKDSGGSNSKIADDSGASGENTGGGGKDQNGELEAGASWHVSVNVL